MRNGRLSSHKATFVDEPTVNLTPLIDVVFVILITFIVIAPLLNTDRVALAFAPNQPSSTISSAQEASAIAIHVHHDNTIWLNQEQIAAAQLPEQLVQIKQKFPTSHLQVFHDKRAHFGIYQSVKNAAQEAGFTEMDVILTPA